MTELKRNREELIKHITKMLFTRNEMRMDKFNKLFSEISLVQFNLMKDIWPELLYCETCPETAVTLQELESRKNLPINRISQAVEQLNNAGLVSWERGEVGTFIKVKEAGFESFKKQEKHLLEFLDKLFDSIGIDRFNDIINGMNELEDAIRNIDI